MGMGYQGFVRMYSEGPATGTTSVLLATGASVNLVLEPIYSSAVWGAGWYNAASSAHYADAAIRYEGTVDVEMQIGAAGVIWDFLQDWIVGGRAYPKSLDISPDGARVYQYQTSSTYGTNYDLYGAWNTSAGFSTSEGSFLTASLGVVALFRNEVDPAGGSSYSDYTYIKQKTGVIASDCTILGTTNPLNPSGTNVNPIPFWRTNAQLLRGAYVSAAPFTGGALPQAGTQTVEWSVDVTQNSIWLYVCSGSRLPIALLQGPMDVTGTVLLYNTDGVFDPILGPTGTGTLTSPYMYAENTWFQATIATGTGDVYMQVPAAVIEADDYSIAGLDAVTNRSFSIKGLGGRCGPSSMTIPPFIMSDSSGAFVAP
jgi:hypothetical protein